MTQRQFRRARVRQNARVPVRQRCPECGQRGPHWVSEGDAGFWLCDKFYGPDGRRLGDLAYFTNLLF